MIDKERISRKRFIGLGAALGSVGASAIAGYGGGGGSAGSRGTTTSTGTTESTAGSSPEVGKGQAITKESEVTPGAAVYFTEAGSRARATGRSSIRREAQPSITARSTLPCRRAIKVREGEVFLARWSLATHALPSRRAALRGISDMSRLLLNLRKLGSLLRVGV